MCIQTINRLLLADKDPIVKIRGRIFPAADFPTQDVINKLMPKGFIGVPENWKWADTYFRQVKKQIDENPEIDMKTLLDNRPKLPY